METVWFFILGAATFAFSQDCEAREPGENGGITCQIVAGETDDHLGAAVAVNGSVALVGARSRSGSTVSVLLFRHDGTSWALEEKLASPDGPSTDAFGESLSVSGDVAIVGAGWGRVGGVDCGKAYVWRRTDPGWILEARLAPSDGASGDCFGFSVSVDDHIAAVGAFGDNDVEEEAGAVYVFRNKDSKWTEEAKLVPPDGMKGAQFGRAVAVSGDLIVIGANDPRSRNPGSAFVYRYGADGWVREKKLTASDAGEWDQFGRSLSASGKRIAIGAPFDENENGIFAGAVYVFRNDGSDWIEEAKLIASDGARKDQFGYFVAINGKVLVAGARKDDDCGNSSGSAYLLRFDGSRWVEECKLSAPDAAEGDEFGNSVAVSGSTVLVGAWRKAAKGENSGAAYFFGIPASRQSSSDDESGE